MINALDSIKKIFKRESLSSRSLPLLVFEQSLRNRHVTAFRPFRKVGLKEAIKKDREKNIYPKHAAIDPRTRYGYNSPT